MTAVKRLSSDLAQTECCVLEDTEAAGSGHHHSFVGLTATWLVLLAKYQTSGALAEEQSFLSVPALNLFWYASRASHYPADSSGCRRSRW